MFQKSQNDEYMELCIHRVKNLYLTWVDEFLDIINQNVDLTSVPWHWNKHSDWILPSQLDK